MSDPERPAFSPPELGPDVEVLEAGPSGESRGGSRVRRPLLIGAATVVGLAVMGALGFALFGLLVGGALTPQGVADDLVTEINDRDLVGIYQLTDPHERAALTRGAAAAAGQLERLGLADPGESVAAPDQIDLEGIDLHLTGVKPTVEKLAPDVAVLRFATGEVTASIKPAETKGVVRRLVDVSGFTEPQAATRKLSELGSDPAAGPDGRGIGLIAIRTNFRWYISPVASAALAGGEPDVDLKAVRAKLTRSRVAPSAHEAAELAVREALTGAQTGWGEMPATLVRSEQVAVELLLSSDGPVDGGDEGGKIKAAARFSDGPAEGSRQVAYVEQVDFENSLSKVKVDQTCVTDSGEAAGLPDQPKRCLADRELFPGLGVPNVLRLFSSHDRLSLTAVKDFGGWKISLVDTLAGGVGEFLAGLDREQVVSWSGRAHLEPPDGALRVGQNDVDFNAANYAVRTLTVEKSGRYEITGQNEAGYVSAEVWSQDRTHQIDLQGNDNGYYRLEAGTYVVVLDGSGEYGELGEGPPPQTVEVRRLGS